MTPIFFDIPPSKLVPILGLPVPSIRVVGHGTGLSSTWYYMVIGASGSLQSDQILLIQ